MSKINRFSIIFLLVAFTIIGAWYWCFIPVLNQLPKPTGNYGVGFQELFIDGALQASQASRYPINIQIWYPCDGALENKYPYKASNILGAFMRENSHLACCAQTSSLRSYSHPDAALSLAHAMYPVMIFTPGFGVCASMYSALIENVASHGYIVVGINNPEINPIELSDGQIIETKKLETYQGFKDFDELWQHVLQKAVENVHKVIHFLVKTGHDPQSPWYHRMNLSAMGCLGHSFGAMVPVALCRTDSRFAAGINIDGWVRHRKNYDKIPVPFLFVVNGSEYPSAEFKDENRTDISKVCTQSGSGCTMVTLLGTGHYSFCDLALLKWPFSRDLDLGTSNRYDNFERINKMVLDFFSNIIKN